MPVLPNPRHERFCQALADGKTAIEAHKIAGFKPSAPNASRLQAKNNIRQRIAELLAQRARMAAVATEKATEKLALTKEWVLVRLMENVERAMQRIPVLDDDGKPTGEWRYEGTVANRALELLGRHLGILIERKEIGEPGAFDRMDDIELAAMLRAEAATLGLAVPSKANGKTKH